MLYDQGSAHHRLQLPTSEKLRDLKRDEDHSSVYTYMSKKFKSIRDSKGRAEALQDDEFEVKSVHSPFKISAELNCFL